MTYSTIESGQGKIQRSAQIVTSLFTNQTVCDTDPSGKNTTFYHYGLWGRLIQTDRAAGTPFAASTYYHYRIAPEHNEVQVITASGLKHRIIFDNAGRVIKIFDSAIAVTGKIQPGLWQLKKTNSFDAYGRLVTEHSYQFDPSGQISTLTVARDYDNLGRAVHVHFPDGVTAITQYDDPHLCMLSYKQDRFGHRSIASIVKTNLSGQPVKRIILPATQVTWPPLQYLCTHGGQDNRRKSRDNKARWFLDVSLQQKIIKIE